MSDFLADLRNALAGHYTIERELGRGGSATVYLAHDPRHDRRVALKLFRPEVAAALGADRFLAEIRTTAALQHPNILALFDSDRVETDGRRGDLLFYVMPFVAGETLRHRLDREGQLPVADAVRIAGEVANALAYAHRQGVVHRDIKPENILFHEGRPLIADFGIATALQPALTRRLTETGVVIGTPQYMSPEQATGDSRVDARADIYALGCVLYEMLVGEPPHRGPTAQAVLAKALSADPQPVRARRPLVPAHVEAVVSTALQRLPADRFQTAEQFAAALTDPTFGGVTPINARASRTTRVLRVAGALVVLAAVAAIGSRRMGSSARAPDVGIVARLALPIPDDQRIAISSGFSYPFDLSRDGSKLVYLAWRGRSTHLFVRRMDVYAADSLPGTARAEQPFFSPNGKWVGFFADGALHKVPVDGGGPIRIAAAAGQPFGASWGDDDTILFSIRAAGLFRVPAAGGTPVRVDSQLVAAVGRENSAWPRWPAFLPDGRHALVNTADSVYVLDLVTGSVRFLLRGGQARYIPTGHLIYAEGDHLVRVVPIDLERLEVIGAPQPVLENVFRGPGSGAHNFAVSRTGTLVYLASGFDRTLVFVDRNGRETALNLEARGYRFPRISPDGNYVAVTVDPRPSHIWILDLTRESATRVTSTGHNIDAQWSPDGNSIAFGGGSGQHVLSWREGGTPRRVGRQPAPLGQHHAAWTRDGWLLAAENRADSGSDLVALNLETGASIDVLATPANESAAELSPDGRWIAFVSDASGVQEVYVLPYRGTTAPQVVSIGGGSDPVWSGDGSELYYRSGTVIMSVRVNTAAKGLSVSRPVELFAGPYDFTQVANWDVAPDGRFLMIKADPSTTRAFHVVLNWFDELRAR